MSRLRGLCAPLMGLVLILSAASPTALAAGAPLNKADSSAKLHPALRYGIKSDPLNVVRVIVQKVKPDAKASLIASTLLGSSVVEEYSVIPAFVLQVPASALPLLAANPNVRYVSPDGPVEVVPQLPLLRKGGGSHPKAPKPQDGHAAGVSAANLVTSFPFDTGATSAWSGAASWDGHPLSGQGVAVAVLDSGVDASHPDLKDNVVPVVVNQHTQSTADGYGHGTHVAGLVAGHDLNGQYLGEAPNARVISVKVTDDNGAAFESDLLRGLDWVNQNRDAYHIGVVNLSVTTSIPESYAVSPIDAAAEFLVHQHVTVVAAAGNLGTAEDAVWYAPANDPLVLTVGCLDDNLTPNPTDDSLCSISSRGVTEDGFAKPDLVAPGRKIVSALADGPNGQDVTLAQEFPDRITADGRHMRLSGTSMAAPIVAGAVALLLERQPGLSPDQVRQLLVGTATGYPGQPDAAGRLNITQAIAGAQHPPKPSIFGPLPVAGSTPPTGSRTLVWDGANWASAYWDSAHWDSAHWDSAHWDSAYWDSAHWDAAYLDSAHWDSAHWDSAHWDSAHWDSAHWDSAHWDSAHWDSAHWDSAHWDSAHWDSSSYD